MHEQKQCLFRADARDDYAQDPGQSLVEEGIDLITGPCGIRNHSVPATVKDSSKLTATRGLDESAVSFPFPLRLDEELEDCAGLAEKLLYVDPRAYRTKETVRPR